MIKRLLEKNLKESITENKKITILYGPRQTGKTTLLTTILDDVDKKVVRINGEERRYYATLSSRDARQLAELAGQAEVLFIDEAQHVDDIGINLKILHDSNPTLKIIATGSSSFDLANRLQEPLTGRTQTYTLYPISVRELMSDMTLFEIRDLREDFLLHGMYPEVRSLLTAERKQEHLLELTNAYLYKDVLNLTNIRHSDRLHKLLQLLALQVGSSVSIHKISNALDLSHETTNHYLDLLEKSFVLFRRSAFSRNLHKEISKMDKIYFYDTGIRNALLENFNPLHLRSDAGALWENFIVVERMKKHNYERNLVRSYYWRVYTGAEIDLIEEEAGKLAAFEIKSNRKKVKPTKSWREAYPDATFTTINLDNWVDYV